MILFKHLTKPTLYQPSTCKFWDDLYIAKHMLDAHLNPNIDAASRKLETIDRHVDFITSIASPKAFPKLLDLGCGPGLYAKRFHDKGYDVTGYDLSKVSIDYATQTAPHVTFIQKNYLELNVIDHYDIITLIYYDFAVLSPQDRKTLLKNIYRALKKDGLFMLDVLSSHFVSKLEHHQSWSYEPKDGFFRETPYICLESRHLYENHVFVESYGIIGEQGDLDVIHVWNTGYTQDTLLEELQQKPFERVAIYEDFEGKPLTETSDTLMMIVKK